MREGESAKVNEKEKQGSSDRRTKCNWVIIELSDVCQLLTQRLQINRSPHPLIAMAFWTLQP